MTFYGGAGVRPAFYEALKRLRNHDYQAADVLFISDTHTQDQPMKEQTKERPGTRSSCSAT